MKPAAFASRRAGWIIPARSRRRRARGSRCSIIRRIRITRTTFHVRDDGWMGTALTFPGEIVIAPGQPLRLRYALYVHAGIPPVEALQKRWEAFAQTEWVDFGKK